MASYPVNRVHDILKRMEDNAAQSEAMKTCFGILAIMSREDANKLAIARDGMDAILNALTVHIDKVDVQEAGCDLLWSLAFNHSMAKDIIGKQGGVGVLVRALKRHNRSADFLKSACGALSNLCQTKSNQQAVATQGGLQPLVGAIHVHSANGRLLPFLFDALAALIVSNEENARSVSALGGIPLIIAGLGRHKSIPEVVKSGCHSLAILSDVKGQASKIAFAGGVPTILPILDSHPSYADLHRVAAVVLLRMLQESSHVAREIICNDGVRILLKSLEKGGAQQDTVAAVTHILYTVTNPSTPASATIEAQLWHSLPSTLDSSLDGPSSSGAVSLEGLQKGCVVTPLSGAAVGSGRSTRGRFSREVMALDSLASLSLQGGSLGANGTTGVGGVSALQLIRAGNGQSVDPSGGSNSSGRSAVSSPYSGAQSNLIGLVQALDHYKERRDVARAGCRLLTNLLHFPGVPLALDRLHVLDRVLEAVSIHQETKDIIESATMLIKAINKKSLPTFLGTTKGSIHGLLTIFRLKIGDDDLVIPGYQILTKFLTTCIGTGVSIPSQMHSGSGPNKSNSRNPNPAVSGSGINQTSQSAEEFRTQEGRSWESEALVQGNRVLLRLSGQEELNVLVTPSLADEAAVDGLNNTKSENGNRRLAQQQGIGSWSKSAAVVLGSILAFVELINVSGRLSQEAVLTNNTFHALQAIHDLIPPKHSELCRRIDLLLPSLNPLKFRDLTRNREKKQDSNRNASPYTTSSLPLGSQLGPPLRHAVVSEEDFHSLALENGVDRGQNGRGLGFTHLRSILNQGTGSGPSKNDHSSSVSENGVSTKTGGSLTSKPAAIGPKSSSTSYNGSNLIDTPTRQPLYARIEAVERLGKQIKKFFPIHPAKAGSVAHNSKRNPIVNRLLDTWPSSLERLLMPSLSQSNVVIEHGSGIPDRMMLCYESTSAAGKEVQSRCITPVPYDVPLDTAILGDPFEHSLTFDSEFESGNLLRAVQRGDACYDLFLRADLHTTGHTQWFYFAVSNTHPPSLVRLAEQGVQVPPVRVKFNIVNLTKPDSLFNLGMRPVIYSCEDAATKGVGWVRAGADIAYFVNPFNRNNTAGEGSNCYYTLTFTVEFHNCKDTYLIAYTYPYTYEDHKLHLRSLLDKPGASDIIRHTKLCMTIGGNDCDLLVITNFKDKAGLGSLGINITEPKEETLHRRKSSSSGNKQPKRSLVISGRVHPGEPPASWMMRGILDFLTSSTPAAVLLRQSFVIFIVPMLNPDGVVYGNNRCCLAGVDLNRQWKKPARGLHPNIYYLKNLMKVQKNIRDVLMYIDLHGHSRKHNVFMYGCDDKKKNTKPHVRAFPKFLSMHSAGKKYVSFQDCSFHVKKGRESTARVVVAKELNIPLSYTLEATFCGANYGPLKHCHMNIGHLQEVGSALCDSMLNFFISEGVVKELTVPGNIPFSSVMGASLQSLSEIEQREASGTGNRDFGQAAMYGGARRKAVDDALSQGEATNFKDLLQDAGEGEEEYAVDDDREDEEDLEADLEAESQSEDNYEEDDGDEGFEDQVVDMGEVEEVLIDSDAMASFGTSEKTVEDESAIIESEYDANESRKTSSISERVLRTGGDANDVLHDRIVATAGLFSLSLNASKNQSFRVGSSSQPFTADLEVAGSNAGKSRTGDFGAARAPALVGTALISLSAEDFDSSSNTSNPIRVRKLSVPRRVNDF